MRAALLELWPALSDFYDLHPWDTKRLSVAELNQYVDDLPNAQRRRLGIKF